MVNINLVPDDYVQSTESHRTNFMCLVLFAVVMAGLGGSFVTILIRQRACSAKEQLINTRMTQLRQSIQQFDDLQKKRKEMMKTALTTAELIEPVPRSILLASLTNNLPAGVSLLKVSLVQKESKNVPKPAAQSKPDPKQAEKTEPEQQKTSPEKLLETYIDIAGTAPSDLQVAQYIERLSNSTLLSDVGLVESQEHKVEDTTFRQFKLKAMLRKEVHLTREDVDKIRAGSEQSVFKF